MQRDSVPLPQIMGYWIQGAAVAGGELACEPLTAVPQPV